MKKTAIMKNLVEIADALDAMGKYAEAGYVDGIMEKVAGSYPPQMEQGVYDTRFIGQDGKVYTARDKSGKEYDDTVNAAYGTMRPQVARYDPDMYGRFERGGMGGSVNNARQQPPMAPQRHEPEGSSSRLPRVNEGINDVRVIVNGRAMRIGDMPQGPQRDEMVNAAWQNMAPQVQKFDPNIVSKLRKGRMGGGSAGAGAQGGVDLQGQKDWSMHRPGNDWENSSGEMNLSPAGWEASTANKDQADLFGWTPRDYYNKGQQTRIPERNLPGRPAEKLKSFDDIMKGIN